MSPDTIRDATIYERTDVAGEAVQDAPDRCRVEERHRRLEDVEEHVLVQEARGAHHADSRHQRVQQHEQR